MKSILDDMSVVCTEEETELSFLLDKVKALIEHSPYPGRMTTVQEQMSRANDLVAQIMDMRLE